VLLLGIINFASPICPPSCVDSVVSLLAHSATTWSTSLSSWLLFIMHRMTAEENLPAEKSKVMAL
jgi:hypothetical protein